MTSPATTVTAERCAAQLLSGEPARTAADVVRRLLAVQGQDPRGARLAIRARSAHLTASDVDRALSADRSLLITWLNRGTLHLVAAEDYWWLHALTTPPLLTASGRRLAQEGVPPADAERGVAAIEAALTADGPLTRAALAERIAAAGVRSQGQALPHLLMLASLRGLVVRGPMTGGEHAYALVSDWLGAPPKPLDRDVALARLARRYLAGHGPADDRDLAKWAGLPLRDARRALTAIAGELAQRDDDLADLVNHSRADHGRADHGRAGHGRADHGRAGHGRAGQDLPPPRLLGAFDPVLLGWVSREPVLGSQQSVVTSNGVFRPFALVRGKAVATWTVRGGRVVQSPFTRLSAPVEAALRADAADVLRFLGITPGGGPPGPALIGEGRELTRRPADA